MTYSQYKNKEVQTLKWLYTSVVFPVFAPFFIVFAVTSFLSFISEKVLIFILSYLKSKLLNFYINKTNLPSDGVRGRLKYITVENIISSFSDGNYECFYNENDNDFNTLVYIKDGEIKKYEGSKPSSIHSIYQIGNFAISELYKK